MAKKGMKRPSPSENNKDPKKKRKKEVPNIPETK